MSEDRLYLAIQLHNEGKIVQAEALLNQIVEANTPHAEAWHLLGVIAYQRGQSQLAIRYIQQAITINATEALFHSNLGEMHRQLKNLSLSIQYGQQAVALQPSSATAFSNLGIAYYDAKQYEQAEACHQQALSINPDLSSSLNNMGSIYKEQNKIKEAQGFYQAAIAASPYFVDPLNNLGVLFLQQHEFTQALEYLSRAILLMPTFTDAQCNLGSVFLSLEQYDEAFVHFEKALQLNAHYAEAYHGLAKVYLYQHQFLKAEQAIRKAMALNPQHMDYYQTLASIYNEQGMHQEALAYLNEAIAFDSSSESLYITKGTILLELGELAQAEEQFLKIAHDPKIDVQVSAHYSLVQLKKIKLDNQSLKSLLSIANNIDEVPLNRREYLYFSLGKCFDDLGEWSKAFEYFNRGCAVKRKRISYDSKEPIHFTQRLIKGFTKELIEALRAFANPSSQPLFIVGMPRSGSTLVEQILSSHARVYGAGELKLLNRLIQAPVKYQNQILRYPENILNALPAMSQYISEHYLESLGQFSSTALHITDKMLHNFIAIGLIHALFPNAKIIHMQRNPIDTCLSCYTKLFSQGQFYSYDLIELGQYYRCYERIMEHWRTVLPSNAWIDIHYEEMVCNLETEAQRLFEFCDLTWDPACLNFYESKRQIRTASLTQVRQPIYTSSVERWRRFESELEPLIQALSSPILIM